MKTVVFTTPEQHALGLQFLPSIPDDTVFRFEGVPAGVEFHSRNVPEPFDVFFMSRVGQILKAVTMNPPDDTELAPAGTAYVLEAKPGVIQRL